MDLNNFEHASRTFSSLLHDVNRFGEPVCYWPVPMWRCWQVEDWLFFPKNRNPDRRWLLSETYWIYTLTHLPTLHERLPSTAGLYLHRRLCLSSWVWTYDEPHWCEENHLPYAMDHNSFEEASRACPTVLRDINQYSDLGCRSIPTWRCWQVEDWLAYARNRIPERRWVLRQTHRIGALAHLPTLHERLPSTGGLYLHRRLSLSSWVWACDEPLGWEEEDHV